MLHMIVDARKDVVHNEARTFHSLSASKEEEQYAITLIDFECAVYDGSTSKGTRERYRIYTLQRCY